LWLRTPLLAQRAGITKSPERIDRATSKSASESHRRWRVGLRLRTASERNPRGAGQTCQQLPRQIMNLPHDQRDNRAGVLYWAPLQSFLILSLLRKRTTPVVQT
jgi:hypothetical protein